MTVYWTQRHIDRVCNCTKTVWCIVKLQESTRRWDVYSFRWASAHTHTHNIYSDFPVRHCRALPPFSTTHTQAIKRTTKYPHAAIFFLLLFRFSSFIYFRSFSDLLNPYEISPNRWLNDFYYCSLLISICIRLFFLFYSSFWLFFSHFYSQCNC